MGVIEQINAFAYLCATIITILLLVAALLSKFLNQPVYKWYFSFLVLNLLSLFAEYMTVALGRSPSLHSYMLVHVFDFLTFAFGALQFVCLAFYLLTYLQTKKATSLKPIWFFIVFAVCEIALALVAQFNDLFSWYDSDNVYHQSAGYPLSMIFSFLSLLGYVVIVLRNMKVLAPKEWITLLCLPAAIAVCFVLEVCYPGLLVIYFGATVALFIMYIVLQTQLELQFKIKEAELAQSQAAIMLSQIQPHFLNNTLTAISELCVDNPAAHKALLTFAAYLRGNMASLQQKAPIAFQQELAHVRHYLWLEQLRYEARIQVTYDIQAEHFMIPVLTLQPIAENAVRHGLAKKDKGGTIVISTRETEEDYLVIIQDDGVGCDLNEALSDGRTHLGISNVQQRLAALSFGSLTIQSAPHIGTTATLKIPKGGEKNAHDRG